MSAHDYVIVGAGSAGCVLAGRLSEDPEVSVLLLEAGPPDTKPELHVPLGWLGLDNSETDWAYVSAPEGSLGGRRLTLHRGRTLGGSSSVNAMIYIRGLPADYDDWRVPGWGWADLRPYFLKAEDNARGASAEHAAGGPLHVADLVEPNLMAAAFIDAAVEAGERRNEDFNGGDQRGAGWFQVTQRDGARWSAADAYLHPVAGRPNLTVVTDSRVTGIEFDGDRASGVTTTRFGVAESHSAAREVIVSGGAYGSPHLLQLAGIGPADHLASRGIEVRVDLPEVGANLSDHPTVALSWTSPEPVSLLNAFTPEAARAYAESRSGPLTSNGPEAGAFLRLGPGDGPAEAQIHALPLPLLDEGSTDPPGHGIALATCVLQPRARGEVRLAGANPLTLPIVRCDYWRDPEDLRVMREGLRRTLEIAGRPSLRRFCAEPLVLPAATDDATLDAFIARHTFSFFHASGTCALGAVVDPSLRVHGVDGLRVVDASVLPRVPRGNTNAVVIAVAERAADLIRG